MNNNISGTSVITPQTIETNQESVQVEAPSSLEGVRVVPVEPSQATATTQPSVVVSDANAIAQANIPVSETLVSSQDLENSRELDSYRGALDEKRQGAPFSVGYN